MNALSAEKITVIFQVAKLAELPELFSAKNSVSFSNTA